MRTGRPTRQERGPGRRNFGQYLRSSHLRNVLVSQVLVLLLTTAPAWAQSRKVDAGSLVQFSNLLQDLTAQISPSVVQITGTGYGLESDAQHSGASVLARERSTGSGVIVSDDGYIMTNAHVVDGARIIHVKVNGASAPRSFMEDGRIVGIDRLLDLALVKIEATGLQPLPFGRAAELKQGELVLAFGSPLGMDNSVTMGIVSAVARQLSEDDPRIFIQTDAPINPGNSGGPLVDAEGHMVGINTFIFTQSGGSEGVGFAIPSNVIRYVYESIKRDGHVHRGQVGLSVRTITLPLASGLGLEAENGVLVEDIQPDGPAAKAGVEIGDVVLSIGNRSLQNVRDLALELYRYVIGDAVELQLLRDNKKFMATVTVTESDDDPERFADMVKPEEDLVLKLQILGLTIDDRIRKLLPPLRIPDGVLVAAQAGSPSYFGDPPQEGDVIHAVNGRSVIGIEALRAELNQLKPGEPLVLQLERSGSLMFLVLEPD